MKKTYSKDYQLVIEGRCYIIFKLDNVWIGERVSDFETKKHVPGDVMAVTGDTKREVIQSLRGF